MFAKVLVANRGEIAVRAFRAAYELGAQTVAVFPYEDRNAVHRIKADEAYEIGERGHPVRAYLDIDEIIRAAQQSGRRRDLSRLRVPERESRPGPRLRRGRHHLHRPAGRRARAGRQQGPGPRGGQGGGHPHAQVDSAVGRPGRAGRRCGGDRLPGLRQGGRRRRRPRHAPGRRPGDAARVGRRPRCARPRARSATRPRSSSRRSAGRGTSRCRSSPTPRGPRCTCTSATARSSGGTRR